MAMADESWKNQIGTGEGEVPLGAPPQPNIETRTMASDLKSMSESGGIAPRPYVPPPPVPSTAPAKPPSPEPPKKDNFTLPAIDDLGEPLNKPAPLPTEPAAVKKSKSKKGLFGAIFVFLLVIGLSAVGYFIVYPQFFGGGTEELPPVENVPPPPAEIPPSRAEEPPVIEEPKLPPALLPLPATIESHTSFFKTAADLSTDVTLSGAVGSFNLTDLKQTLALAALEILPFTEFVIKDANGAIPSFYEIARLFAPATWNENVLRAFESNYTYFVYTDDSGDVWPGIIAKTKQAPTQNDFAAITKLETNNEAAHFFLTDPGAPGTWKTGQVNNKPARYLAFSKAKAALSYTWFDNYLLLSTNYAGAKEAAKRLGY